MWFWLSGGKSWRGLVKFGAGEAAQRRRPNDNNTRVPQLRDVLPQIAVEFERARRYERTVTVAVVAVASDDANDGNGNGTRADGCSLAAVLPSVLRQVVREIDLVTCDPATGCCIVVMPEIGADEGRKAVSRMRELCAARLSCPIRSDIAVFPRDGWVFLDLVDVARRNARQAEEPSGGQLISNPAV